MSLMIFPTIFLTKKKMRQSVALPKATKIQMLLVPLMDSDLYF